MDARHLIVRREEDVEFVTINRPDVRNAFNAAVVAELADWASRVAHDASVRAAVLSGAGAHFSAGADLAWMREMRGASAAENRDDARRLSAMFGALDTVPFPLVGRVQGAALGGGTGLVAVCDVAIAADTSVFGFTEVKLGILPAAIAPFAIAKIGVSAARELFLTGARFPARRALELGLVHRVVPEADLDTAVEDCLREVRSSASSAIARAKALIREVAWQPAAAVIELTSQAIADQRVSEEGQEGIAAFLEKRPPRWCR